MAVFERVFDVLRSAYFHVLVVVIGYISSVLFVTFWLLFYPFYLYDKYKIMRLGNKFIHFQMELSAIRLNPFWKVRHVKPIDYSKHKKPRIYMWNHQAFSDPFILNDLGKRVTMSTVYKDSLHKIPLAKTYLEVTGNVPIRFKYDRQLDVKVATREAVIEAMEKCLNLLKNGFNLGIFPEGKRSRTGPMGPFKDGFFRLAVENGIDIVPCALSNTRQLWPNKPFLIIKRGVAYVNIGEPISSVGKTVDQLREETRRAIYKLLRQCPSFDPVLDSLPEYET